MDTLQVRRKIIILDNFIMMFGGRFGGMVNDSPGLVPRSWYVESKIPRGSFISSPPKKTYFLTTVTLWICPYHNTSVTLWIHPYHNNTFPYQTLL